MLAVGAASKNNVNSIESFSSRGPTPYGRIKPDVVGADCGATVSWSLPFCGTSQAAPHVAGMVALVRQRFPSYTPAQVTAYVKDNAQQRISSPDPNNTWGHGFFVLPQIAQPLPSLPGAPATASVTPGTASLTVSWRTPIQTGGTVVTAYDLRHIRSDATNKGDANWTVVRRVWTGSGALSHTLTSLAGATRYDVQVRAVNSAGEGPWSATVSGTPSRPLAAPGAPIFVSATPGSGTLSVVWSAPPDDGGSAVTSYDLRHIRSDSPTRSDADWSVSRRAVTGLGAFRYSLAGLMGGTRYDVQVRAVNAIGEGSWSATASGTPLVQAVCEDSNVVPNASSNTQLVSDCDALLAARDTLAGAGSLNWSGDTPMTRWQGVRLSGPPNRVVELRIQGPLQGQIAPELGRLSNLTLLDLSYNQLNGTIPAELGNLPNLRFLSLQGNQLTGPIPTRLGNLSSLELMQVWSNQLTGTMPAELGQLTNLEEMSFSDNRLTGAIPRELGRMASLRLLALSGNRLTGSIPAELANLANLQTLKLSGNQLTGCLPAVLRSVEDNDLTSLGMSDCGQATVPGAPTLLSAFGTAHDENRIYLSWDAPSSDGGAAITGYRVEVSENGSTWTDLAANTDDTTTRHTHTGLTARSTRHYRVSAINSVGTGPGSNTATGTTGSALPVYTPGAPTGLTATANGQTQIDLSWSGPINDGGAAITGYHIEVSADHSSWSDLVADTGHTVTSYSQTGLTAGSTRHYRVSAINSAGTGPASNTDSATINAATVPDLVVDRPTVSESAPEAEARFTLSAAVRNQGNGSSDSTTLRYYRSSDSAITTGDTEVGTDSVFRLDTAESGDESVSVTAPSSPGTYYYGACVESVSGESDTTNNCSAAVTVTVDAATSPDLIVSTFTVDNSSPVTRQYFTLNATVNNQGNGSSSSTTLRYYRSTDATITTSDSIVPTGGIPGYLSVDGLSPSGSEAKTARTSAPSTLGTYYYGACVETVSGESDTTNNCSPAATVTVQRTNQPPRLTGEVDDKVVELGESFTVDLSGLFTDPDDDEITGYGFTYRTRGILSGTVNNRTGILSLRAIAVGETIVAVDAGDSNGQWGGGDLFKVTVVAAEAADKPGAPTGLTATADGQTEIDLSWTAPSDDGGADITGYRIEVSTNGSNWSKLVANTNSTSTSYSHTGLTAGSARHYRVSTINSVGTGPASDTDSATTDLAVTKPGAPTGLTATADGQTKIDLSWTAPSDDGGADITGYKIEVSTNGSSWSDLVANTGSTSTSYSHTGLSAGSTRHYRVSAINSEGTGMASDSDSATTDSAVTKPGAPTGLTATANGQTEIDLSWTAPSDDGGADITGYRIEVSENSSTWSDLVANTGSTSTSYAHSGLDADSTRHYRVSAINSVGTGTASDTDSATTAAATEPGKPTGLTATADGQTEIDLAWTAPSDDGGSPITGYKVQWKAAANSWDTPADVSEAAVTGTGHTIAGLTDGVEYSVRVIAANEAGGSPPSTEQTGTPNETVPPALSTATVDGATLTLTYNEALDDSSAPAASAFTVMVGVNDRGVESVDVTGSAVTLTLASAVTPEDEVVVSYAAPADESAERLRDEAGNPASSFTGEPVTNETGPPPPFTASIHNAPDSHDGQTAFTFELRLSEAPNRGFSYKTLEFHAFNVEGGTVKKAQRMEKGNNMRGPFTLNRTPAPT